MEENIGKTIVRVSRNGFCLAAGKIVNIERGSRYSASGYFVHEPGFGSRMWFSHPETVILDKPLNFRLGADLSS